MSHLSVGRTSEHPDLEHFRQNFINDLEAKRYYELTGRPDPTHIQDREMSEASTSTMVPMSISRESTATMRGMSEPSTSTALWNSRAYDEPMDIDSPEIENSLEAAENDPPIIVATDFGTTFSSVAYARRGEGSRPVISVISNWPEDPLSMVGGTSVQVPTESWYPDKYYRTGQFLLGADFDSSNGSSRENSTDIQSDDDRERNGSSPENSIDVQSDDDREPEDEIVDDSGERNSVSNEEEDSTPSFVWGYGIQAMTRGDLDRREFNRVSRSKLLLDKSGHTAKVRNELGPILRRLKKNRIIEENEDVIAHYLTVLFMHAKQQLRKESVIQHSPRIEHVLCVPAIWTPDACRKMQKAMTIAVERAQFGTIENLFLVSEPEAAAAYVLGQSDEINVSIAYMVTQLRALAKQLSLESHL